MSGGDKIIDKMKQTLDTPTARALNNVMKESRYLPSCESGHKILWNYKGDNSKAGYCKECDKWFMVVSVSENTVRQTT